MVIQTGTIAAVAVAFGKFAAALWPALDARLRLGPLPLSAQQCVAIVVIAILTAANCTGLRTGRQVQNVFTANQSCSLSC